MSGPKAIREVEIGRGVIDCSISSGGELILGCDVSGRAVVLDRGMSEIWSSTSEMPAWGADINVDRGIVALALADKQANKGALKIIEYESGRTIKVLDLPTPAWDTVIDHKNGMVYATTWGSGLIWYDLDADEYGAIGVSPNDSLNLFGIGLRQNDGFTDLTITMSAVGVLSLRFPNRLTAIDEVSNSLLLASSRSCYNHFIDESSSQVFVGSSTGAMSYASFGGSTKSVRTSLHDICGVAVSGTTVVHGALSGEVMISRSNNPSMPIGFTRVDGGVWSIVPDPLEPAIWIARDDGFLAQYSVDEIEVAGTFDEVDSIQFGPGSFGGAKVFLSYASEDRDNVADLYRFLRTVGCVPWMDIFDILPGQEWRTAISRAIHECDFVLVILSSNSVTKRGYVQKEIKTAMDLLERMLDEDIFLIPARLEECTVPALLANRQWVDLFKQDGLRRLCLALHAGLSSRGKL